MASEIPLTDALDPAANSWLVNLDVSGSERSASEIVAGIERLGQLLEEAQNDQLRRRGGRLITNRGDFDVLRALRNSGPPFAMTPSELHDAVLLSSAGLSGKLNRLELEGWIQRERAELDGRSRLVSLTPEGRAELEAYLEPHLVFERSLLAPLDGDQRDALISSVGALIDHLETGAR